MLSSKVTVAGVRAQVQQVLYYSTVERRRNFLESVELQIILKNYDTLCDKRFSGNVQLPVTPRPQMSICVISDQHDLDRAKHLGVDALSLDDLKRLHGNKKLIKKLVHKYDAFIASDSILRLIPRLVGPILSKTGKFPSPVSHSEDLALKVQLVKSTIKFQLKRNLCLAVVVGNVGMMENELLENLMRAINYLISLLKKGWHNVGSLIVKSTMSPARRIY